MVGSIVFPTVDRPSDEWLAHLDAVLRRTELPAAARAMRIDSILFERRDGPADGAARTYAVPLAQDEDPATLILPHISIALLAERLFGGLGEPGPSSPTPLTLRVSEGAAALIAEAFAAAFGIASAATETERPVALPATRYTAALVLAGGERIEANVHVPDRTLAALERRDGGGEGAPDSHIETALGQVRVTLRAVLARPTLTAGEIAALEIGSVIAIPAPDRVTLVAGGYRIAHGTAEGAAVTIDHLEQNA